MVFLLWLVEGLPAITNHSTKVRHAHTRKSADVILFFTRTHTHTHAHMPVKPNSSMQRTGATTDMPFGLPADLAQRWETTSRTTSNSNIATHSATSKGTRSFPNDTGSHTKMPH